MNISKTDFCNDLLLEHFNPAGPINKLNQTTNFINRPFVKAIITEGFASSDLSRVRVELKGLKVSKGGEGAKKESFSFECFDINCFESTLEETQVHVSGACKQTIEVTTVTQLQGSIPYTTVTTNAINTSLPPEIKTFREYKEDYTLNLPTTIIKTRAVTYNNLNKNNICDLYPEGGPVYYARGEKDVEGTMYFADFGYIDPLTKDFILSESNVSFSFSKVDNILTAISTEVIPREVKAVRIKELKSGLLRIIGIVYGQLEDSFYFPHPKIEFARDFLNQDIYLEDLSLNLLMFMAIKNTPEVEGRIIYRQENYSSPEIEFIIQNSFSTLENLLNNDVETPQYLSIPQSFKSFTKSSDEYTSFANTTYTLEEVKCFEDSCFEEDCFKTFSNNHLINRSIDNQALAWTVIAYASYIINYSNFNYIQTVVNLMTYILTQKNSLGLFYRGWNDSQLKGTYSDSLVLKEEIDTSTNIAIFLALLKAFEVTQDFSYILEASLLQSNIEKYLVQPDNTFSHGYNVKENSIESSVYSLIYCKVVKDYKKIPAILKYLNNNIFQIKENELVSTVLADQLSVKIDQDQVFVEQDLEVDNFNQLFIKSDKDTYNSDIEILKINFLTYSSLVELNNQFDVPFVATVELLLNRIEDRLVNNRKEATGLFSAACLLKNQPIFQLNNTTFNSLIDLNNFNFTKELLFSKMIKLIPTEYSWIDNKVLHKKSNIGSIIYASATEEALNSTKREFINRMSSISYMYGVVLTFKAQDLGLTRLPKESDEALKERIKVELTFLGNSKNQIEEKLSFYDATVVIKDNYKLIQAFNSSNSEHFSNNWGEGYLSGTEKASALLYTVNIYQPLEKDLVDILNYLLPVGIKSKINEVLSYDIGNKDCGLKVIGKGSQEGCIGFRLSSNDLGCSNIDLQTGDDLSRESGGKICKEDDETLI